MKQKTTYAHCVQSDNRDLQFRIWLPIHKKYAEEALSGTGGNLSQEAAFFFHECPEFIQNAKDDGFKVELWSGFYDSEGVQVFENDILECNGIKARVKYENAEFIADIEGDAPCCLSKYLQDAKDSKTIGNIHNVEFPNCEESGEVVRGGYYLFKFGLGYCFMFAWGGVKKNKNQLKIKETQDNLRGLFLTIIPTTLYASFVVKLDAMLKFTLLSRSKKILS